MTRIVIVRIVIVVVGGVITSSVPPPANQRRAAYSTRVRDTQQQMQFRTNFFTTTRGATITLQ